MSRRYSDEESRKLWDEKYTFFWYNEAEIFHWTQEDFDEQARKMHEAGTTNVMTFSATHFRWTFLKYKKEILEALRKLVLACHKYGIAVEEHHSCHLTYIVHNQEEADKFFAYFKGHHSSREGFVGIDEEITRHREVNGKSMDTWVQIDGRTGQAADTGYVGHAFCFNNPDYRKAYFDYVRELKETGIDSLLADDVQYFGDGNACTCEHCRRLFHEQTGYTLPPPEQWGDFYNHYERPDFVAWRRFRLASTTRFQQDLTRLYKEIGLNPYRANYRSTLLHSDSTANTFFSCLDMWAQTFQENMLSAVIRQHWIIFYSEALIQNAVGERKNAPSMSLFYPTRHDQYYFAWALSESWGQLPFLCPEGSNLIHEDKRYNSYEIQHAELFRQVHKLPDFALLLSKESLDFADRGAWLTAFPVRSFMQGAYFEHLQAAVVCEDEPQEAFNQMPMIIAAGARLVTAELLARLKAYVEAGGKLLIVGGFAEFFPPAGAKELLADPRVTVITDIAIPTEIMHGCVVRRMYDKETPVPAYPGSPARIREQFGKRARALLPRPAFVLEAPDMYLTTAYRAGRKENTTLLHIVNVNDMLVPEGTLVSHADPIPHFQEDSPRNSAPLRFKLSKKDISRVTLHSPERQDSLALQPVPVDDGTIIDIPADSFAGYALLELQ